MTPTLPRRSFLGWTAALAGCALLTRPALAVPPPWILDVHKHKWVLWVRDPVTGLYERCPDRIACYEIRGIPLGADSVAF